MLKYCIQLLILQTLVEQNNLPEETSKILKKYRGVSLLETFVPNLVHTGLISLP